MSPTSNADSPGPKLNAQLLEASFNKVRPHAGDFSKRFYENLFADYPAAEPLFSHVSIEEQGKKLFSSLILVVTNLKYPDGLQKDLQGLGARHIDYGALPEHYPLVGQTLLKTLSQFLKEDWTPELQQAWTDAYDVIAKTMLEGADYASQDIQLDPAASLESPGQSADIAPSPEKEGSKLWPILAGGLGILGTIVLLVILL